MRRITLRSHVVTPIHTLPLRTSKGMTSLRSVSAEAKAALRTFRGAPAFFLLLVGTMAVGTAATTAVFGMVFPIVLRPLPYPDSRSIVSIQEYQPAAKRDQSAVASASLDVVSQARTLGAAAVFEYSEYVIKGDGDAERRIGVRADSALFELLGATLQAGRGIQAADAGETPQKLVVISERLSRRQFGEGATSPIGRSLMIDGVAHSIIGIMSPEFEFPRSPAMTTEVDLWVPRSSARPIGMRQNMRALNVVARLSRGSTTDAAERELNALAAASESHRSGDGWQFRVVQLRDVVVGKARPITRMLLACVGFLIVITTVNIAAAMLSRAILRSNAFVVRLALGAKYRDVFRLLLVESMLAALVALILAVPLAALLKRVLIEIAPFALPRQQQPVTPVLTTVVSIFAALAIALIAATIPALWIRRATRSNLVVASARTGTGSVRRKRFVTTFIFAQVLLASTLLTSTVRLYSNYMRINRIDPGFKASNVQSATVALGGRRYRDPQQRAQFSEELLARVRALPGVEHAALTTLAPLSGGLMSTSYRAGRSSDSGAVALFRAVSTDFFGTLRIPITKGRPIDMTDRRGTVPVVVISQALARAAFGTSDPIGSTLSLTPPGADSATAFSVVGVSADVRELGLDSLPSSVIYVSDQQASLPHTVLLIRGERMPGVRALRAALHEVDQGLVFDDVTSLRERVHRTFAMQYFLLVVIAGFAASAVLMIVIGIYGAISFVVAEEQRAMGIKLAFGATAQRIVRAVVGNIIALAGAGAVTGTIFGVLVTQFLDAQAMFGSESFTVATTLSPIVTLVMLAGLASFVPARRAGKVDPVILLRED